MAIVRSLTIAGTGHGGAVSKTISILPGTFENERKDDTRGGREGIPAVVAGKGANGKATALIDSSTLTLAEVVAMPSGVGVGNFTITDATNSAIIAKDALLDVIVEGDAVQFVTVMWKGTIYS